VTAIGYQVTTESARWFGRSRHDPGSVCTLFCLPYSGSGASVFHSWRQAIDPRVEVVPVHLPGREDRIAEPLGHSPAAIAAAIAGHVNRPYGIYGHSIGARLGFEVIRSLRRLGAPPPVRFYPAAARPPDVPDPLSSCAELADDDFLAALIERIAAPAELRDVPELRELLLPVLRADFEWVARYRYRAEPPLGTAVTAISGDADPETTALDMLGWARQTSASFRLHTLPGNHFFLRTALQQLTSLISADLLAAQDSGDHDGTGGRRTTMLAPPGQDEVHVWLADLDDLPGACSAWNELSPGETLRAGQIREDAARRAHIGRCVVLRRILRRYGMQTPAQDLVAGANGKAEIRHPSGIRVSVSQSAGLVLAGVTTASEIGVDIERTPPTASFDAFSARALDPAEHAALLRDPEPERLAAALRQVTHLPLTGAIGAIATAADGWRLRFETVTEVRP
jgi:surfactin synthase thioesterase subunit